MHRTVGAETGPRDGKSKCGNSPITKTYDLRRFCLERLEHPISTVGNGVGAGHWLEVFTASGKVEYQQLTDPQSPALRI